MAEEIAKLGFSADTNDLKKAKADLDAIVPSAKKVEAAAESTASAFDILQEAAQGAAAEAKRVRNAADDAAAGLRNEGTAAGKAAGALDDVGNKGKKAGDAIKGVGTSANDAAAKLARMGTAANDNLTRVQATPANIAAQLQDIGVTAAAGMNPMIIGLQQGMQLIPALSGGLANLGKALAEVFSPRSIVIIGLVALVAALIEMVNWVDVAKVALNGMADVLEVATPYLFAFAAGLALINVTSIVGGIVSATQALWGMVAAMVAAVGWPALLVAGLVAMGAAAVHFRDELTQYFGFDIVGVVKDSINFIVGAFVAGVNIIRKTWSLLIPAIDDVMAQIAASIQTKFASMINSIIDSINHLLSVLPDWMKIGSGQIAHWNPTPVPNASSGSASKFGNIARDEWNAAQGKDYVGMGIDAANGMGKWAAGKLRGFASGLGEDDKKKKGHHAKGGKTNAEKFDDLIGGADRKIAALKAEQAMIGLYGEALYTAKAKQDMLNEAAQKGIVVDGAHMAIIDAKAAAIGRLTAENERLKFMEDQRVSSANKIADMQAEMGMLQLYGEKLYAAQIMQSKLNEARQKHIDLTPAMIAALQAESDAEAKVKKQLEDQKLVVDQARSNIRGFFQDIYEGAKKGENAFDILLNAFSNFLNRIADQMANKAIDQVTNSIIASMGFANGGAFNRGTQFFADGGIVSSPTSFAMSGGRKGMMGEEGPEAIVPLKRGSDGSLGVQMFNQKAGGGTPNVSVTVNNTHVLRGAMSSEDVIALNKRSAEQTKQELRAQVPQILKQYQRDGSFSA